MSLGWDVELQPVTACRPFGHRLRLYQAQAGYAIFQSVQRGLGLSFSVMIARQGGKNELSAYLESVLLALNFERGGDIVKCAPPSTRRGASAWDASDSASAKLT